MSTQRQQQPPAQPQRPQGVAPTLVPPVFNTSGAAGFQPANKNKRFVAFIIDGLISGAFGKILSVVLLKVLHIHSTTALLVLQTLLVASAYWVFLTVHFGATPGKKIMGLRIVTDTQSENVSVKQLFLRETLGRVLSTLPLCLGYLWVSWDKQRRTFHDMIAKTRVVDYK